MKALKKLAGMILAVCLMVPVLSTAVFAADGVLMFSDPSTKVGENVSVDLVVQSSSGENVGSVNVTMNYDTASLEFVGGEGFTADGSGNLTYTGTGSSAELRATMQFRALLAGKYKHQRERKYSDGRIGRVPEPGTGFFCGDDRGGRRRQHLRRADRSGGDDRGNCGRSDYGYRSEC